CCSAPFPRPGGPSELGLAPQTAEPLAPYSSNPAPDHPAGRTGASPEPHRSTSDTNQRYYGEAPVRVRWGYGGTSGWQGTLFFTFHRKQRTGLLKPLIARCQAASD